jgi:hypothetical protein
MPLKPKNPQPHSDPLPLKNELSGPWGRINPEPQAVIVLRICKKISSSTEETHSYPYRVLSSWHWRSGAGDEELKIEAGSDLVTIRGHGLERLVEALDQNTLEVIREAPMDNSAEPDDKLTVSTVLIASESSGGV